MAVITQWGGHVGEDILITDSPSSDQGSTDITGWTLGFYMRKEHGGSVVLTKTTSSGITITSAATGVFTVAIDDTDTADFTPGNYVYEVARTNAGAAVVITKGTVTLWRRVADV